MFCRGTFRREMQVQMPTRRDGGLLPGAAGHVSSPNHVDRLTTLRYYQPDYTSTRNIGCGTENTMLHHNKLVLHNSLVSSCATSMSLFNKTFMYSRIFHAAKERN